MKMWTNSKLIKKMSCMCHMWMPWMTGYYLPGIPTLLNTGSKTTSIANMAINCAQKERCVSVSSYPKTQHQPLSAVVYLRGKCISRKWAIKVVAWRFKRLGEASIDFSPSSWPLLGKKVVWQMPECRSPCYGPVWWSFLCCGPVFLYSMAYHLFVEVLRRMRGFLLL